MYCIYVYSTDGFNQTVTNFVGAGQNFRTWYSVTKIESFLVQSWRPLYASHVRALATYLIIHIFVQSWTELNWNAEVDKI